MYVLLCLMRLRYIDISNISCYSIVESHPSAVADIQINSMKTFAKTLTATLIGFVLWTTPAHAQGTVTEFVVTGSSDSAIGAAGQTLWLSSANGYHMAFNDLWLSANTPLSSGLLEIDMEGANNAYWSLVIQTPTASIPLAGMYAGAARWPFQSPGQAGMDLGSNGRGENQLDGWFDILELNQTAGVVDSLAIDFYQHGLGYGSGRDPWEFGSVRYNSSIAITQTPEPGTLSLMAASLLGIGVFFRRK